MKENKKSVSTKRVSSHCKVSKEKQEDFIMLPTVDFCFKELMQNDNIRKNIIAALLNVSSSEVENTELMPTILRKESKDDKYGILDVRVKLKDGEQIDFEMQVEAFDCWANRSVYYLSKMYTSEIKEGDGYDCLKKCIHVSILAYDHFQDDKECYRRIAFCDTKTGKEYTDLMEMHILELSKLPPEEKNETSLLQWMRFLGGKTRKDFEEMAKKNSELEEAYDVLDKLSADEKKRLEYETRQRAIRDYNIGMLTAERRGIEAGREEGENRINQLNIELSKLGRTEDILKEIVENHKRQEKILFSLASCHPCRIPFFKPCCENPHQYRNQIIHKDKHISKSGFLKQKGPDCCQHI